MPQAAWVSKIACMADFSAPAPRESLKLGEYLHERGRIPAAPDWTTGGLVQRYLPLALGVLFAMGAMALAFQTRASWSSHREWVVPATTPLLALGGVALGYMVARGKVTSIVWPAGFLFLAVVLTIFNRWRGSISSGEDTARNVMTVLTAILLGVAVVSLILTMIVTEVRDPAKPPPAPEA